MRPVSVEFGKRKQASEDDGNQRRADMATVYVKCKPGRRAYFEGRLIPQDKFVPVDGNDPTIQRAIYHWQDLEVEGGAGEELRPGMPLPEHPEPKEAAQKPVRPPPRRARPDDPGLAPQHQPPASPKE
jgi:hypothetical protein